MLLNLNHNYVNCLELKSTKDFLGEEYFIIVVV